MPVREPGLGDGQALRRLWDDLGGWYRNTSPTSDTDVDRAIGRALRQAASGRRLSRRKPAECSWVSVSDSKLTGWLFARADPEQNYIVPLVPPEDTTGAFESMLDPARVWFRQESARRFVVDVPTTRPDLRSVAVKGGKILWHRAVLDRDLSPLPSTGALPETVRDFRRSDLAAAESLFRTRHPEKPPPPIPVAFLELRGGLFRDPAWEMERAVWVAGSRGNLLGVAGGNHRPRAPIGFLGPWVLAQAASPPLATSLLAAVLSWFERLGARRVRTTTPTPPSDDAQVLLRSGFASMAESDLFEIRV